MLNKIIIMGRLTKDPELRKTSNGNAVCSFSLAVDRDRTGKDSEKQTDFINVVAWRSTAEIVAKYCGKGRQIVVSGSLQSRQWEDKNGQKRTEWEVQAEDVYFADSKRGNSGETVGTADSDETSAADTSAGGGFATIDGVDDDDLPF